MGRALLYGFLLLMAGFFLLPVYLVVLTALKEPARITLDGKPVRVDRAGRFVIGFGRDARAKAVLRAA